MRKIHIVDLLIVILTFFTISASGLGDVMSQSFTEIIRGNYVFAWITYKWWWTKYIPLPFLISSLAGHSVPSGIDMTIGSVIGIVLIAFMWFYYYRKNKIMKLIKKFKI